MHPSAHGQWGDAPTALIIAHPGHELLVHHWLELTRPLVFILTDGAGGADKERLDFSRRVIGNCSALAGAVFGAASDKSWYRAILACDTTLFHDSIAIIAATCHGRGVRHIVCDPVELFNPMHDLANAVAHATARAMRSQPLVWTYPLEHDLPAVARWRVPLSTEDVARKHDAIKAYAALAHEHERYQAHIRRHHEILTPDAPRFTWPETLSAEPFYERFGRQRLHERRYADLISYDRHVRPLAAALLDLAVAAEGTTLTGGA